MLHILGLMTAADAGSVRLDGDTLAYGKNCELRNANCELTGEPSNSVNPQSAIRNPQLLEVRRRKIGFVFQRFNLMERPDGADNVEISLRVRGMSDGRRAKRIVRRAWRRPRGRTRSLGRCPSASSSGWR